MSDIVYSIEVQFLQNGAFAGPSAGLDNLKKKTDSWAKSLLGVGEGFAGKFNSVLDSVGGAFVDVGAKAASGLAAAFAVGAGAATKMAFHFNEDMENTSLSLAAIANANGIVENMGGGFRIAGDVIKEMRKDAAVLPGEFEDLKNIMATIAGPAAQMGIGMWGQEKLSKDVMMAAAITGVDQKVAAREAAMLLSGNARHNMPFFNRLPFDMDAKEFNHLDPKKRLEVIRSTLGKIATPENIGIASNTFQAIKTTAISNMKTAMGLVGAPLFLSVKDTINKFNAWSTDSANKERLADFGLKFGDAIQHAFERGVDGFQHWFPIVETFGENLYTHLSAAWTKVQPLVEGVLGHLESFMKDPQAFDKIVRAGEMFAGARLAGGAAQVGFSAAGSLMEMGGGGAGGLALLGEVALPAALALASLGPAVYGAVDVLTDASAFGHDAAMKLSEETVQAAKDGMTEWAKVGHLAKPLVDAMGVGLLYVVEQITGAFAGMALVLEGAEKAVTAFVTSTSWLASKFGVLNPTKEEPIEHTFVPMMVKEMNTGFAEREKERKVPQNVTHIHKVEIKVNSNQDPNRIAKRTAELLIDLSKRPKTAGNTGTPFYTNLGL